MIKCALKCGSDVLVFNAEKQQVAFGIAVLEVDGRVGIKVTHGDLYDQMKNIPEIQVAGTLQHTYLHFNKFNGDFLQFGFSDVFPDEIMSLFTQLKAVNKFEFDFGICTDHFKDYPGYRGVIKLK